MPLPPSILPTVAVSWDGSGAFTGPFDVVTSDVAADAGVTIQEGRDGARSLAPPRISAGSFELLNHTGKYSQHRADSPVYQRVLPGRPVSYSGVYGTTDAYDVPLPYDAPDPYDGRASWGLGRHVIDAIAQTTDWGQRRVQVSTLGAEIVLKDAVISVPLQTNLRTDQCVTLILNACGWPVDKRQVSVGDTMLSYFWVDERHPWDALVELLAAEGPGTFYVSRLGDFCFENRNYRTTAGRSATSQATFRDHAVAGGLSFTSLQYEPGYQDIYNRATFTVRARTLGALGPVWRYGSTLTLSPGQAVTLIARPSDPFQEAVAPADGTDYVVAAGSATVALGAASGLVAFIEVAAGAGGATLDGPTASPTTGLQLRARSLPVTSETTVENDLDASASIATYSPIAGANIPLVLPVAGWPELDAAAARAVCNAWVARYMEPRPVVTIAVVNADDAHLAQIVARHVSDRITVSEANTGLDTDLWINAMETRIAGPEGRDVAMRLSAEVCNVLGGAVWDTAHWNADDVPPLEDAAAIWGV
jgi:hypothetical protein